MNHKGRILGSIVAVFFLWNNIRRSVKLNDNYKIIPFDFLASTNESISNEQTQVAIKKRQKHKPKSILDWKAWTLSVGEETDVIDGTRVNSSETWTMSAVSNSSTMLTSAPGKRPPNRWEASKVLPQWIKDYFLWHQQAMEELNLSQNYTSYRFLIARCLKIDATCGGASDRIHGVPYMIRVAHESSRLLLIDWERPHALENFLLPPHQGGLDWRVPLWLKKQLRYNRRPMILGSKGSHKANSSLTVVDMRHQSHDHGYYYYNERLAENESSFDYVYSDIWAVMFRPAPAVAELIDRYMTQLGLVKDKYVSVHIRAVYVADNSQKNVWQNAIHCASELFPGAPVFVASDSLAVTTNAIAYGRQLNHSVVGQLSEQSPLHLDRGRSYLKHDKVDTTEYPASSYYDTFVDLYMLAQGRCIAYNSGGFGKWANVISSDNTCCRDHGRSRCSWTTAVQPPQQAGSLS